ncbi:2-keto-4-pentenoate hydratase [Sphingomonas sanxanigenens]|uniref:2-keto-4-pentenoate hydratase n=1 Tax=Sphingomonas sanxanigenens DSM 19645 = NX02 TaxID=1123269 RepID=W0A749_9SPHN|nr:2-keto-4-pentenoate hydratase [Sphingomonas sanxanigenens]AHE53764.1 hypothetical protein NX02_10235 [Sphingomonas sanxanigenens DSM 19645 = NX02]
MTSEGIAHRFVDARLSAGVVPDYPGEMPQSLSDAYAIQAQAIPRMGATIGGWKVGRILGDWVARTGGAHHLAGPIFADTIFDLSDDSPALIFEDGFGAAEAEFLLRVGAAPEAGKTAFTLEEAAALIDAVHIGFEIASSPFPGINDHGPAITISDFGNNNGLLIGPAIAEWRTSGFEDAEVSTTIDGAAVGTGKASAFVDGTIGSVRFLFENLARRGLPITPGQWVSTGAVTGVHKVTVGQRVEADFGRFGTIGCTIGAQQPR